MLGPKDLENYLKEKGVEFELKYHEETYSAGKASQVLGIAISDIIKSLLFMNEKGEPILVIVPGNKRVNQTQLANILGFKKLRLAREDEVIEHTGYEAGGIPPVGHKKKVTCLIDEEVMKKEYVYGGGGAVNTTLKIKPMDILNLTEGKVMTIP
ncbi:MAG: YbaK/EbsC family protein [Thermoproteota archaeon]|jgi:Cys-tRNA(Pro) deacylase|nr:YbaK/EbsC family protein [Thermoproteota archaeon]